MVSVLVLLPFDVPFFDKYFRRYVGMSPLEYRNS